MGKTTFDFADHVAVVTGGSHGIGRAAAEAFAQAGAHAVIVDIDDTGGEKVTDAVRQAGGQATFLHCDVTSAAEVTATFDAIVSQLGRLDVLVNSAGGFATKMTIEDTPNDEWDRIMDLNLKSAFLCSRAVIPTFRKQRGGSIINIGSTAGLTAAALSSPAYSASKAGVHSLTRVSALELAPHGATANALAPATTATDRVNKVHGLDGMERIGANTPIGRVAQVDDIVGWILFLATPEARYLTGQTISVNGGRLMV